MKRPKSRRGRAAILWGVGFFLLAQLGLSLVAERWLPIFRDRDYSWKMSLMARLLEQAPDRPLVLFVGSSRTLGAFQAGRIHGEKGPDGKQLAAFNLGQARSGPIRTWIRCQHLLEEGARPRLLLVEVLPLLLNEAGPDRVSEEDWVGGSWSCLDDLCRFYPYCSMRATFVLDWLAARLVPSYFHRNYILDYYARSWAPPNSKLVSRRLTNRYGWYMGEGIEQWLPHAAYYRTLTHWQQFGWQLKYFQLGRGPAQALRDLVARCKQEHVPLALVLLPEPSAMRRWYLPAAKAQVDGFMDELRQTGVEIIDAREWIDDCHFCDALHLLPQGAHQLTDLMREEIHRLLQDTAAAGEVARAP